MLEDSVKENFNVGGRVGFKVSIIGGFNKWATPKYPKVVITDSIKEKLQCTFSKYEWMLNQKLAIRELLKQFKRIQK